MKYAFVLLPGIAYVAAQTPSGLAAIPSCGQLCISNMVQIANTEFGCSNGNVTCYCSDPRFGYGLNDCSLQACGAAVQSAVLAFGESYCSSAGVAANTGATSVVSSAQASASSAASGSGSGSGSGTGGSGAGVVAITTSPILTTISTGGSVITSTVGSTTIFSTHASGASGASGTSSASGASGSASSGASGAAGNGTSGTGSGASGASGSKTSSGGSGASSAAAGASSSSSKAMGAIATVAPMVGAGAIAALLML